MTQSRPARCRHCASAWALRGRGALWAVETSCPASYSVGVAALGAVEDPDCCAVSAFATPAQRWVQLLPGPGRARRVGARGPRGPASLRLQLGEGRQGRGPRPGVAVSSLFSTLHSRRGCLIRKLQLQDLLSKIIFYQLICLQVCSGRRPLLRPLDSDQDVRQVFAGF